MASGFDAKQSSGSGSGGKSAEPTPTEQRFTLRDRELILKVWPPTAEERARYASAEAADTSELERFIIVLNRKPPPPRITDKLTGDPVSDELKTQITAVYETIVPADKGFSAVTSRPPQPRLRQNQDFRNAIEAGEHPELVPDPLTPHLLIDLKSGSGNGSGASGKAISSESVLKLAADRSIQMVKRAELHTPAFKNGYPSFGPVVSEGWDGYFIPEWFRFRVGAEWGSLKWNADRAAAIDARKAADKKERIASGDDSLYYEYQSRGDGIDPDECTPQAEIFWSVDYKTWRWTPLFTASFVHVYLGNANRVWMAITPRTQPAAMSALRKREAIAINQHNLVVRRRARSKRLAAGEYYDPDKNEPKNEVLRPRSYSYPAVWDRRTKQLVLPSADVAACVQFTGDSVLTDAEGLKMYAASSVMPPYQVDTVYIAAEASLCAELTCGVVVMVR